MDNKIFIYTSAGKLKEVIKLIEEGISPDVVNESHETPLYIASNNGNYEIAEYLVKHGATIDIPNDKGWTPLIVASFFNDIRIVSLLLHYGADVNHKDNEGNTPLVFALKGLRKARIKEVIKLLFKYGANPNTINHQGETIYKILANEKVEILDQLIKGGLDPNLQDINGDTGLIIFSKKNKLELLRGLLKHSADPNIKNKFKNTALIYASGEGYLDIVKSLVSSGAEVNARGERGETALAYASIHFIDVVKYLLENDADPNIPEDDNVTPLMVAAENGQLDIAQLLIDYGAYLEFVNSAGQTAEEIARINRHYDVEALITFYTYLLPVINYDPKIIFGENLDNLSVKDRKYFIEFIERWEEYCETDNDDLPFTYLKFIAKFLGLKVKGRTRRGLCSDIYIELFKHLQKIETLDYSMFNDNKDPIHHEYFTAYPPFELYQYGDPIEGKYRGITNDYIDQSIREKTFIVDPMDRSSVLTKNSVNTNTTVYKDYLKRRMIPKQELKRSKALEVPSPDIPREESEPQETIFDKLSRFTVPELISFIDHFRGSNAKQIIPEGLNKTFYIPLLLKYRDRFHEIPQLQGLN